MVLHVTQTCTEILRVKFRFRECLGDEGHSRTLYEDDTEVRGMKEANHERWWDKGEGKKLTGYEVGPG